MSDNSNTQILVAGALAAFTVDLLVYPLDTIKTRYQSQDFVKTYASSSTAKASTVAKVPVHAFRGLYQGVGGVIVATLPAAGIFFTTYESAKRLYTTVLADRAPQPLVHALASGTAELASCLVLTPAEVVKQNAQMLRQSSGSSGGNGARPKSTTVEALRMVWHSEAGGERAVRRLWSGYTALAARNLPYTALQFPIFEFFRVEAWAWRDRRRRRRQHNAESTIWGSESAPKASMAETGLVAGLSAAGAGAIAAVVTTPTDVVKTRMMLAAGGSDDSKEEAAAKRKKPSKGPDEGQRQRQQRISGFQVARLVFREKGFRGLFRGGALRAAWTALGSGIYLGSYEAAKAWLIDDESRADDLL